MWPTLSVIESQLGGLSAVARHDHQISLFPTLHLKCQELSVWRPARKTHQFTIKGQLRPLSILDRSNPHIHRSILDQIECDLFGIGRKLGELHSFTQIQKWILFTGS